MPQRGKRCWAKALRKASALPITFRGGSSFGVGGDRGSDGGFDRVGGGVTGVTGHVGSCGGVTGGTGGGARFAACYLTTHPSTRCFNGFAWPVVFRVILLEAWEHVLGAVGGPKRQ
jgi:hypothetical protein